MSRQRDGSLKADVVERFKALHRAAEGGSAGGSQPRRGLTENGLWLFRYDDEGRLWAAPFRTSDPASSDDER